MAHNPEGISNMHRWTRSAPPGSPYGTTYGENEPACSENCLVLNVWTPAVKDGRRRPVMVYTHGGGYVSGPGGSRSVGSHTRAPATPACSTSSRPCVGFAPTSRKGSVDDDHRRAVSSDERS